MGRRLRHSVMLGLMGTLALSGPAPVAAERDGEAVADCVRRNLPQLSARQALRLRAVDAAGGVAVSQARLMWRRFGAGTRAVLRLSAPEEVRGSALLVRQPGAGGESSLLLHLPELGGVRRVSGPAAGHSLFGTDFSPEDFARLQGLVTDPAPRRLTDGLEQGLDVWVVETRPAKSSAYTRIVSHVDQRRCVPLRVELYGEGGRLLKEAKVPKQRIARAGKGWVPTLVLMRDLRTGTYTELIVDDVELEAELPEELFSERALVREAAR